MLQMKQAYFVSGGDVFVSHLKPDLLFNLYFAAMALQGMLANPELIGDAEFGVIAKRATEHADELLKELDK